MACIILVSELVLLLSYRNSHFVLENFVHLLQKFCLYSSKILYFLMGILFDAIYGWKRQFVKKLRISSKKLWILWFLFKMAPRYWRNIDSVDVQSELIELRQFMKFSIKRWIKSLIEFQPLQFTVIGARLSKSGSYVGSLKVGKIVDRRIGSWIVRSYIFSYLKQKIHW